MKPHIKAKGDFMVYIKWQNKMKLDAGLDAGSV
jgi:hypothetical protein